MIVRKTGGVTEFIPSLQEKRDGLFRDNFLNLLINLDVRVSLIENKLGISLKRSDDFSEIINRIKREESQNKKINRGFLNDN